jgi:hypothetical protein
MKEFCLFLTVVAVIMCAATAQAGLISHYTFDNTANNAVSGAPNGTVNGGAPYVAGKLGNALSFDGTKSGDPSVVNQYVDITTSGLPVAGNGLETGTMAMWIKTTDSAAGWQKLICASNSGNGQSMDFNTIGTGTISGGGLEFYLREGNNADLTVRAAAPAAFDGQWHHVAVTWNATTGESGSGSSTMYLDGNALSTSLLSNSITSSASWSAWQNPMRIAAGGRAIPSWEGYNGSLDDVRVYNNVLSGGEVAALAGVPEPAACMLLSIGAVSLLAYAWRKRR